MSTHYHRISNGASDTQAPVSLARPQVQPQHAGAEGMKTVMSFFTWFAKRRSRRKSSNRRPHSESMDSNDPTTSSDESDIAVW